MVWIEKRFGGSSYNWLGKRLYHDLIETFNSKGSRELVRSTRKKDASGQGKKTDLRPSLKKCFSFRQLYFLGPPLFLYHLLQESLKE